MRQPPLKLTWHEKRHWCRVQHGYDDIQSNQWVNNRHNHNITVRIIYTTVKRNLIINRDTCIRKGRINITKAVANIAIKKIQVIAWYPGLFQVITSDKYKEFVNPMYINTFATFATWEIWFLHSTKTNVHTSDKFYCYFLVYSHFAGNRLSRVFFIWLLPFSVICE